MFKINKFLIPLVLILLFLSACGYTPIFSQKDITFNVKNIKLTGNKIVKQTINGKLSNYKNNFDVKNQIDLILDGTQNVVIITKNVKGEATSYKVTVDVKIKVIFENNNSFEKTFIKSTTYNAVERASELKTTENKLTSDLSIQIANEIILILLEK